MAQSVAKPNNQDVRGKRWASCISPTYAGYKNATKLANDAQIAKAKQTPMAGVNYSQNQGVNFDMFSNDIDLNKKYFGLNSEYAVFNPGVNDPAMTLASTGAGPAMYKNTSSDTDILDTLKSLGQDFDDIAIRAGSRLDATLDQSYASGAGGAFGVARGIVKNGFAFGELGTQALRVVGYEFGMVNSVDYQNSIEYFKNIQAGTAALMSDPTGVVGKAFGDRYNRIDGLNAQGKYFEAGALTGETVVDIALIASGGYGVARGVTTLLSKESALLQMGNLYKIGAIAGNLNKTIAVMAKELSFTGLARGALAGDLPKLARTIYNSGGRLEAQGVAYAYLRMSEKGYKFIGDMIYNKSGNGLDMVFQNIKTGNYAVMEAKNGGTLGGLGEAKTFRQGSAKYIEYSLNMYKKMPSADAQLVTEMHAQMRRGDLESFASLRSADRLVQFDLNEFTGVGKPNLNVNRYFIDKNIPR